MSKRISFTKEQKMQILREAESEGRLEAVNYKAIILDLFHSIDWL